MHDNVDVFIRGSKSADPSAATSMARYETRCKIVDSRSRPLENGQADGVQTRITGILSSFGLVEDLLKEGCHDVDVAFFDTSHEGATAFRAAMVHTVLFEVCLV